MISRDGLRLCIGVRDKSSLLQACSNEIYSHLQYTIPPAIALTVFFYPLWTSIDAYKILFLVAVSSRYNRLSGFTYLQLSDCGLLDNTLGLLPNTQPNLDISKQCYNRTNSFQNSSRRNLLLCHSNIQHLSNLLNNQQAHFSSCLPPRAEVALFRISIATGEMARHIGNHSCDSIWHFYGLEPW